MRGFCNVFVREKPILLDGHSMQESAGGICLHFHFLGNENRGVAAIWLAASKCPPDACIKRFKSQFHHKNNTHPFGWVLFLWRSRRDLNPRYPFGVHTISSRARYDHFDTAPCGSALADVHILHHRACFVKPLFYFFRKNSLPGKIRTGRGRSLDIGQLFTVWWQPGLLGCRGRNV